MRIEILKGVLVDDKPVQPRPAAAIATLLTAQGLVTQDELRRTLWHPEEEGSLPNVLTKLRHRLGDSFVSSSAGYRLVVDTQDYVDLRVFRRLVDRAEFLTKNDPETASLLYSRALDLWVTPPLQSLPLTTSLDTIRQSLLHEWCEARERLAEIQLRLGAYTDLIRELPMLLLEESGWEHLRALLMRALYAKGHKFEALRSYQQYADWTRAEYGAEPGPELMELASQIQANRVTPTQPLLPLDSDLKGRQARVDSKLVTIPGMVHYLVAGERKYSVPEERASVESLQVFAPEVLELGAEEFRLTGRLVRHLVKTRQVQQVLQIGAPPPSALSPHEVAASLMPGIPIVYTSPHPHVVDLYRAEVTMDSVTIIQASLSNPVSILEHPDLWKVLDPEAPTLVLCMDEQNYLTNAGELLKQIMDAMAPGSWFAGNCATGEGMTDMVAAQLEMVFSGTGLDLQLRTAEETATLIPGLKVEPVVHLAEWGTNRPFTPGPWNAYALVGHT